MGLVIGSCRQVRQPEPEFVDDHDEDVLRKKTAFIRYKEWNKNDKEFILKVLKESPSLVPPMSDFEVHLFPEWLRNGDRDVVLAFTRRPDFVKLVQDRHFYPPNHHFKGDKEIMLAYCSWTRSLQQCSNGKDD